MGYTADVSKDDDKKPAGRGGLSLAPLSLEEAVAALLEVKPDPPRKRSKKPPEKTAADKPKDG
jgi:hypothetical protein